MHQPTLRVIEVLNYILSCRTPVTMADISKSLSIPKGTLSPILQTLCELSYITKDNHASYSPGLGAFVLGTQLNGRFSIIEYAKSKLDELVKAYAETCYFGTLENGNVLYLASAESPNPLRMLVGVGNKLPAYATGIGKALLCDMTKPQLEQLYHDGLKSLTPNTVCSFEQLDTELKLAKEKGYTVEIEESTEHIRCFGVPVYKSGKIVAAISIAFPVFRYREDMEEEVTQKLIQCAADIGEMIEKTNTEFK